MSDTTMTCKCGGMMKEDPMNMGMMKCEKCGATAPKEEMKDSGMEPKM